MTKPKPKAKTLSLPDAMKRTGFSTASANGINEFWERMGITSIKIGSTKLVVKKTKKP